MRVGQVRFGWKNLEEVINGLIDAINANEPLEGQGVTVEDKTGGGKMISVMRQGKQPAGTPAGAPTQGDGAQPQLLRADSIEWYGVKWQDVTIVDENCAKSTIKVLVSTGSDSDSIVIAPIKYPIAVFPS